MGVCIGFCIRVCMIFDTFPTLANTCRTLPPDDIGFSTNRIEIGNDAREQNTHK